jgi:Ca-dependent carbohydrate-binding module xylan-binding/Polysaccharide lyase
MATKTKPRATRAISKKSSVRNKKQSQSIMSYKRFSWRHMTVFVVVFAAIAAAIIYNVLASIPSQKIQAESFTFPSKYVSESLPSGTSTAFFKRNVTATKSINVERKTTSMITRASSDNCSGWGRMVIKVDGTTVQDVYVDSAAMKDFKSSVDIAPGQHTFSISFVNDYVIKQRCDRNLQVDHVTLLGEEVLDSSPAKDEVIYTLDANKINYNGYGKSYSSTSALLWSTGGVASATVSLPREVSSVSFYGYGDQCLGEPRMQIAVDNTIIMKGGVKETSTSVYTADIALGAGNHQFTISLLNDFKDATCDRNIRINKIEFRGKPVEDAVIAKVPFTAFNYGTVGRATSGSGLIWANGSASAKVSLPGPASSINVYAYGEPCSGNPQMELKVDGVSLARFDVSSTSESIYAAKKVVPAGARTVEIGLINDYRNSTCDRNVRITQVEFLGKAVIDTQTPTAPAPSTPKEPAPDVSSCNNVALLMCEDFEQYPLINMPDGDQSYKNTVFADKWLLNQSCPGRVSIVPDPLNSAKKALKMVVHHTDVSSNASCPAAPNENPRAQLVPQSKLYKNDDVYMGFKTFFPSDFPKDIATKRSYLQIAELFGPPTTCTPPVGIYVVGNKIVMNQGRGILADGKCDVKGGVWTSSENIQYGTRWEHITLRVKLSDDPAVGFVEIWHNGKPQTFNATGSPTRYYMRTLVPGVNYKEGGYNKLFINSYRGATAQDGYITLFRDDVKIGKTYEEVQSK